MAIKIPNPQNWQEIEFGTEAYPSLFDFSAPLDQKDREERVRKIKKFDIGTLARIKKKADDLEKPLSYLEVHRAYQAFRVGTLAVLGIQDSYKHVSRPSSVAAIRYATSVCLGAGIKPADGFKKLLGRYAHFRSFDLKKQIETPNYVFSSNNVWASVVGEAKQEKMGYGSEIRGESTVSSYEAPESIDPRIRVACLKIPEFDPATTDKSLLSYAAAAETLKRSPTAFIPSKLRACAQILIDEGIV